MKRTKLPGWKIAKIEWRKHLKKRLLKRKAAAKMSGWKIAKIEWRKHLKKRLLKRKAAAKMSRRTRKQQRKAS